VPDSEPGGALRRIRFANGQEEADLELQLAVLLTYIFPLIFSALVYMTIGA
jgi:hypothetical protein